MMLYKFKTYPIKYRFLIPLLVALSIFSFVIFILFNSFSFYVLNTPLERSLTEIALIKVNIIFLIILLTFIVLFVLIIIKICNSISKSVLQISNDAKKLGNSSYKIEKFHSFSFDEIQDLNNNVHKLAKKLLDYHTSQKTLLANASHELRTPLMSIQGYAEGIKYDIFNDISQPLDIIIEESKHLSEIITNMLTLSAFDFESINIKYNTINLYDTIEKFAYSLGGLAVKLNKKITINGEKNIFVSTDESLLFKAISNILSNAIRYAKENIEISFECHKESIIIHISDDGDGISKDDLDNLFTRFYKGKKGNVGLGLSISQSCLQYLGGEITAYNTDCGACFDITLNTFN
ncbi:MAG: HAMP domain-containing sensor histidine kinase [Clostridium sp.]|nr:HAMP domain-containing sensor histidine kinase [Clostridium sp.]